MIELILLGLIYPLMILVAAYFLYGGKLWRGRGGWVFVGVGYMLLAILVQIPIQEIPTIITIIRSGIIGIMEAERSGGLIIAIYAGSVAGLSQEIAKFFAVKDREPTASLWVGYGFAIIDVATIIASILATLVTAPGAPLQLISLIGLLLNPMVSMIFHPGTAMFLRYSQGLGTSIRGLIMAILAHAYIDSYAAALNYLAAFSVVSQSYLYGLTTVMWSTALSISIIFLIIGNRGVRGIGSGH
ncbi:MAG: hypothetical protein RXR03_07870 [Thermocladium sp.]